MLFVRMELSISDKGEKRGKKLPPPLATVWFLLITTPMVRLVIGSIVVLQVLKQSKLDSVLFGSLQFLAVDWTGVAVTSKHPTVLSKLSGR
ncbi:hypothetical protein SDC9_206986 [bioreactor metagenome]|uniref:Uncharacterized protein n=1 Tax=bioreactor metagenome TaxID=1076179 RepID=A0A645J6C0_9ZZZZ